MTKKYFLLIFVLIFAIFFLSQPTLTKAQLGLSIFPEKVDLKLKQGEKYQTKIKISNLTDQPLPIQTSISNFSAANEKEGMIFYQDNNDLSFNARLWFQLEEESFSLKPRESKEVNLLINVPINAESGGYYLAVLFRGEVVGHNFQSRVIPTLGSLFLLTVEGEEVEYPVLNKQMDLIEIGRPFFINQGLVNFSFRLKNNDPSHIKVGGYLNVYNIFNKLKEQIIIEDQTILPGKIRFFEARTTNKKFFEKILFGPYRAELVLSTQTWREKIGNRQQLIKKFNFFALPWKIF